MRNFTVRHAFQVFLFAAAAGSFAAWAGDAALISALEGNKTCTASFENATWTPALGETLPEKTGLEVGPDTSVNLVHFGMNSEVTIPAGSRVTILQSGIEGLAADAAQAKLEAMPQGLDLEARHQQQVGAVNPQHIAQMAPARGGLKAARPASPPPPPAAAKPAESQAAPAPAPAMPMSAPAPVSEESMPKISEAAQEAEPLGGSTADKFAQSDAATSMETADAGAAEREAGNAAMQLEKEKKLLEQMKNESMGARAGGSAKSGLSALQAIGEEVTRTLSPAVALPLDALDRTIGGFGMIVLETSDESLKHPATDRLELTTGPDASLQTWILAEVALPAGEQKGRLTLTGPASATKPLEIAVPETADLAVATAVRLEFRGFPAQAAAVWIKLVRAQKVTPEIASAHLRRLATAIEARLK
ncbi:MAG TPA: hypothetical protein PLP29_15955 [Candidatus Ozemobacteraceae bacterium]|nr:hypothetical protein [Candidatus Ozemobacteraceae bacterium]